jgi:hypothetical protein
LSLLLSPEPGRGKFFPFDGNFSSGGGVLDGIEQEIYQYLFLPGAIRINGKDFGSMHTPKAFNIRHRLPILRNHQNHLIRPNQLQMNPVLFAGQLIRILSFS